MNTWQDPRFFSEKTQMHTESLYLEETASQSFRTVWKAHWHLNPCEFKFRHNPHRPGHGMIYTGILGGLNSVYLLVIISAIAPLKERNSGTAT